DIEMPSCDELVHLTVEEGKKQGANVAPVDVGVGHDNNPVIAELAHVEVVRADTRTESRDERADLFEREHLIEAGLLNVKNLALEGKHRLICLIASLLRRAAGGVPLNKEKLCLFRVLVLTIREFSGK